MLREIFEDGSIASLALTGLLIALALLVERLAYDRWWSGYFRVAFPLGEEPLPLHSMPEARSGSSGGLRWRVEAEVARWAVARGAGTFPSGLHGTVALSPQRDRVALTAAWCPPWTPFLTLAWFACIGASQGQGYLSVPIALAIGAAMFRVFQQSAARAVGLLRFTWATDDSESD